MFGTARTLRARLTNVQRDLDHAESHIKDLQKQIQDLKADLKGYKEAITDKENELEKARNIANARLSAMTGVKRYLDAFFQQEGKTQDKTPEPRDNQKQSTPDFKNPDFKNPKT